MELLKNNSTTINQSARPIYYFSRLLGYAPISMPKHDRNNKVTIRLSDIIVFITYSFGLFYLIYWNANILFDIKRTNSMILDIGGQFVLLIGMIISTCDISLNLLFRHKIWEILQRIYIFDNEIAKLGVKINHQFSFKISFLFTLFLIFFITLAMVLTIFLMKVSLMSNPLLYFSYFVTNTSFTIIMSHFLLFIIVIKSRFSALNTCFCCYFSVLDKDLQLPKRLRNNNRNSDSVLVKQFAKLHDQLNDIVGIINFCYSVQIMATVGVCFGFIIFCFFALYRAIFQYNEPVFNLALVYLVWCVYYSIFVTGIVTAGSSTTREGKLTGALIHKAINRIIDNSVIEQLKIFSLQLQQRSPTFSCGLFPYDWTLYYSILGAAATYLIILIQFDSSSITPFLLNDTLI